MNTEIEKQVASVLDEELRESLYDSLTADEAFAFFNEGRDVTNTVERPVPLTVAGVLAGISQESASKLVMLPSLTDIRDKIQANDLEGVLLWGQLLAMADIITPEEATAIQAACVLTEKVEVTTREDARVIVAFVGHAGFPNQIDREAFDAAWSQAGRK